MTVDIRDAAARPGDFDRRFDVIVVGSGAGGSVVAARLAEAGLQVAMLEEGPLVPSSRFNQRDRDMYPLLFRDGGLQGTEDGGILVMQGRCVGGSTVVNMADVTPVPSVLYEHWRLHYDLEGLAESDLEAAVAEVRREIGANRITDQINAANAALLEGAEKLGYRGATFEHSRVGCVGSGYCQTGCAYDAKRSALVTWVPRGLKAGVTLFPRSRAERIRIRRGRVEGVDLQLLADDEPTVIARRQLRADHVFVCAGGIHTPLLLRRSRAGGRLVGQGLSLQPQAPVMALFDRPVRSFRGIPQSVYVDEFETVTATQGMGGFRVEGAFGPPATASAFLPAVGPRLMHNLARFDQLGGALVLVPDRPTGEVAPQGQSPQPRIHYRPRDDWWSTLREGIATAAELWLAAGAVEVWLPGEHMPAIRDQAGLDWIRREMPLAPVAVRLVSAHPQGTARMSDNPRKGVVSSRFAVHGVDGLYVADASVFPTTSSSHTQLPVMSFAWVAAERFLEDR